MNEQLRYISVMINGMIEKNAERYFSADISDSEKDKIAQDTEILIRLTNYIKRIAKD